MEAIIFGPLVLGHLLLCLRFATAWDAAVITKEDIEFFTDGQLVGRGYGYLKELSVGAYDPVRGFLYVSDANHPNASIFRVDTQHTNDPDPSAVSFQPIVSKQSSVQGIAFDPVSFTLFWTTGNGNTIVKLTADVLNVTRPKVHHPGRVVHQFEDGSIPRGIAVDSCRQKLYWTNIKVSNATIERSAMDGSQREVIASTALRRNIKVMQPYSIILDQQSKQLYWCDVLGGASFQIVRSDLDGSNPVIVISHRDQEPYGLSVVGDQLYWTDSHQGNLLSLPKYYTGSGKVEPTFVHRFSQLKKPDGVISNTLYLDVDPTECVALAPFIPQIKKLRERESIIVSHSRSDGDAGMNPNCSTEANPCLNDGSPKDGVCRCPRGFTGTRCEQSVCHNYCLSGSCQVDEHGRPTCRCSVGWSGLRCEIELCRDFCFNDGRCSIGEDGNATCKCAFGFIGNRCEFPSNVITKICKAYCKISENAAFSSLTTTRDFKSTVENLPLWSEHMCGCSEIKLSNFVHDDEEEDDGNKRPLVSKLSGGPKNVVVIVLLAMMCVLLGGAVIFLTSKVLKLGKRPRIRKRIVVNRPPPAPFRRPSVPREQCEITIENCCNMNICDTPCFEPEFRSSKPTFSKKKSEDKRTLITEMHSNSSQDDENY